MLPRHALRAGRTAIRAPSTQQSLPRLASAARAISTTTTTTTTTAAPTSFAARPSAIVARKRLAGLDQYGRASFHSSPLRKEVVKVPQMAESITEGTLKQWNKKVGDFVKADEEVATIETDKIDVSVNAPQSGTIVEVYSEEEDTVTVGKDLFKLEPGEAPSGGSSGGEAEKPKPSADEAKPSGGEDKKADKESDQANQSKKSGEAQGAGNESYGEKQSDLARDASQSDRKPSAKSGAGESKPAPPPKPAPSPAPKGGKSGGSAPAAKPAVGSREEKRVKMSRMRLRIAERLKQSQNTAASLTTFNEIDMSALMEFRKRHKDRVLKEHGVKLGFMSAFAKASAMALKEIPAANASIEGAGLGDTIVYRDYVDLSVAVSTEKGLVTPVVRNVEGMNFVEIEQNISDLGKKARDNKLTLEDMAGGTFTISNGGVFGSLFGTPILNLPGSAILGMHAINDKPWVVDGKVEVRPIMVVALTYDHRLLDGREAVTFLVRLKQYIEDPAAMLLA